MEGLDVLQKSTNGCSITAGSFRTFAISTKKNGHVTQCLAVADLVGVKIEAVLQIRGLNKALPEWQRELEKLYWIFPAIKMAWTFRKGEYLILASGRSVLPACRLIKFLRGNEVFILFIGSPKKWTTNCADLMLRPQHERELGVDEEKRYPWCPKQVWVNSPICNPLPVSKEEGCEVVILLGGLNITYGDEITDYSDFLNRLDTISAQHSLSIIFSRRTKKSVQNAIKKRFAPTNVKLIEATDRQGFLNACESAGAFIVTPDSITMVVEACATGKPVYIPDLPVRRVETRNHRFIEMTIAKKYAKHFDGNINFARSYIERKDIENARQVMTGYITSWSKEYVNQS